MFHASELARRADETSPAKRTPGARMTHPPADSTPTEIVQDFALREAIACLTRRAPFTPRSAIVLGTGLGDLADRLQDAAAIDYAEIPGFARPTALAHKGRLVFGRWNGREVVALQGRCHVYEGRSFDEIVRPIRALAAIGVQQAFLTNAAGGLNPRFAAGDVMAIDDHIDFMFQTTLAPTHAEGSARRPIGQIYDSGLLDRAMAIACDAGVELRRGVYLGVTGPNYETRAEYRMMRRLGADAVGMSTIPEAIAARQAGLRVAAFSAITNVARPDAPEEVDAQEVVDVATDAAPKIERVLGRLI